MAPIAKCRRVLGPHARPLLWRPRTRFERGYIGRCAEGIGGGVVSEGTNFFFFSFVFVSPMCAVCSRHMISRLTVDFTGHELRGLLFATRQPSSGVVTVISDPVCSGFLTVLIVRVCLYTFS
jgi:hypothetical protein